MQKAFEGVVIESQGEKAKVRCLKQTDGANNGAYQDKDNMIIDVANEMGAEAGQRVLIENKEYSKNKNALLTVIVPLLAIGLGGLMGYHMAAQFEISVSVSMILGGVIFGLPVLAVVKNPDEVEHPSIIRVFDD
ncbi:MAG: SoxR reducing system RseC family protein [Syntrophomonas sp.]|nr:SoxR reducing system RseC family protein [Syntrophomonas sp.]